MGAAPVVVVGAGQSGLAAAGALADAGLEPLVLEASDRPAGSWPRYYDSLKAFSPALFDSLPGLAFPGDPDRYPSRDEVADYLEAYAARLGVEIRTRTRAVAVRRKAGSFVVETAAGEAIEASAIVAASGSFDHPYVPELAGEASFRGKLLHVAAYRNPEPYRGARVVVVGGGDSAVQVASDLAGVAAVTLASRRPLRFIPQLIAGRDVHHWFRETGFDDLPGEWLQRLVPGTLVTDSGGYAEQLALGRFDRRAMFSELSGREVVWSDGRREVVDAVILATGYRPNVEYLRPLGALESGGAPLHTGGVSTTTAGLVYVGLEYQRSYASNTLRGVAADAKAVVAPLAAYVRDSPRIVGMSGPLSSGGAASTSRTRPA